MRTISVTAHKRPYYLERVLDGLAHCAGIERYEVTVWCDPSPRQPECAEVVKRFGFTPVVIEERPLRRRLLRRKKAARQRIESDNADRNTARALTHAFGELHSPYHLHLEDDTVPAPGALLWFEWAERFKSDPSILTVSGYHHTPDGEPDEYAVRAWFTPWGFATWKDRWEKIRWIGLCGGWDTFINRQRAKESLSEAHPCVSRIQNIGALDGLNVRSAEWHAEHHHARKIADELVTDFELRT
jgi:hypothetical protein